MQESSNRKDPFVYGPYILGQFLSNKFKDNKKLEIRFITGKFYGGYPFDTLFECSRDNFVPIDPSDMVLSSCECK